MPIVFTTDADQATVASLVEAVFTHLDPTSFGILNRLTDPVGTSDTTITVDFDTQKAIRDGAYVCIDVEVMYVWAFDEATKTATVERGMLGSIPSTHNASALVQIQPRVSNFDVLKELGNEIRSWPPALFQAASITVPISALTRAHDLPIVTGYRILSVSYTPTGCDTTPRSTGYTIDDNADPSIYASGKAIVFDHAYRDGSVIVTYAAPFTTSPFAPTTTIASTGLTDTMLDIPVLGAASRLLREAPRTDTRAQGQSSTDARVPPGFTGSTRTALRREADTRIHQEIARLRETYPQRRR